MALSIFDRLKIAAAVHQGQRDFEREMANYKKEQRRANRAAGKNENNGEITDSNNSGNTTSEKKYNKKEKNKHTEVKTEQQINAEAQAPEEPVGAEKIKGEVTVDAAHEATMGGNVHIGDPKSGKLEFMGASIDIRKMVGELPSGNSNIFQQATPSAAGMNSMQQFEINPMSDMNTYGAFVNQQQAGSFNPVVTSFNPALPACTPHNFNPVVQMMTSVQQQPGHGLHRIDNPAKPKPQKPPKSDPEQVDMAGMPNPTEGMEIVQTKKIDVRTYGGLVTDQIPQATTSAPIVNRFEENNKAFYHDYPYLAEVEKVALDNDYQIGFVIRPNTNLIECHIYTNDGVPIPGKGFTIDPGMIIDRRKKIFPTIAQFYEGMNAYPLFVNNTNTKEDGKKAGNILNVEVLTALIIGGSSAITVRGMYTEEFRNLNRFVALITIPTDKIQGADRKYIQNRLVDLYKDGTFSNALAAAPGSRFRVAEYNRGSGTILLDTDGVPANFGGQYIPNERIQLKITKDKCKTLMGDNIIDILEKNQH